MTCCLGFRYLNSSVNLSPEDDVRNLEYEDVLKGELVEGALVRVIGKETIE